jgi:Flp pilus assembly protein TadB
MPEVIVAIGAVGAGALCGGAVLSVGCGGHQLDLAGWFSRPVRAFAIAPRLLVARNLMTRAVDRAGWRESPQRTAVLATALAVSPAVVAWGLSPLLAVPALIGGCAACALTLRSAIARRRRRLLGELVPLLELFTLELSGGGSALAALGSVSVQVDSELARDLRRMLIASQVAGSASFEARLLEYSDRLDLPALGTLATILAASRDYGTAASQGVRALATDLRRAQRRELIAQSRRALNNVLLPAAVAVLLPFLGILMFPAVSVLQASLR